MRYVDLVAAVKWLLLFVASLALDNAFGTLYEASIRDHIAAVRMESTVASDAGVTLEDPLDDICLYFPEEILTFFLLLYFVANMIRYFVSSFWEFIPLHDSQRLNEIANLWVVLRFGFFATLQVMVIAWQGKALADPFTFFYLLAFLFGTDILWGLVSRVLVKLFQILRFSKRHLRHYWIEDALLSFRSNAKLAKTWTRVAFFELVFACIIIYCLELYKSPFDHRHTVDLAPIWLDLTVVVLFVSLFSITILDFAEQRDAYKKITRFLFAGPSGFMLPSDKT